MPDDRRIERSAGLDRFEERGAISNSDGKQKYGVAGSSQLLNELVDVRSDAFYENSWSHTSIYAGHELSAALFESQYSSMSWTTCS